MRISLKSVVGIILLALIVYLGLVFDVFRSEKDVSDKTPGQTSDKFLDKVHVDTPLPGDTISSPIKISGEARGYWFFEATFPIKIIDVNGTQIGIGYAKAKSDWMTESFVPFDADLTFNLASSTASSSSGFIRLERDNPSGLPENDGYINVPVVFSK